MLVHPAESTQVRDVTTFADRTYDNRQIPRCCQLILDVITEEEEKRIAQIINPRYPSPPEQDRSIPVSQQMIELKKRMSSQYESFLYEVSGIRKDKPHHIMISVPTLAPDDKINWKSDGFMMTLNMGSDAVVLFRKKGTQRIYKVYFPRRAIMIIKDPFLDYDRKFDDADPLTYQASPFVAPIKIERKHRYMCLWALSQSQTKYKYEVPTNLDDFLFHPSNVVFDLDLHSQISLSADEVKRYVQTLGADVLVDKLMNTPVQFPYHKYYIDHSVLTMFQSLQSFPYRLRVDNRAYKEVFSNIAKHLDLFPLRSSIVEPYCTIVSLAEDYDKIDSITNCFSEEQRMQTVVSGGTSLKYSPYEWWYSDWRKGLYKLLVSRQDEITTESLHENMRSMIKEATLFKVSMAYSVLRLIGEHLGAKPGEPTGLRYLDMSSGWGDRLIASIAAGCSRYLGYDPNAGLQDAYRDILQQIQSYPTSKDGNPLFEVRCEPFEKAKLPREEFDVCFTSPPYFNFEIYTREENQSAMAYPSYNLWLNKFFFISLRKIWYVLREGGILAIHIQDVANMPHICAIMNLFIQAKLTHAKYMGVISSQTRTDEDDDQTGRPRRPIWIWKKGSSPVPSTLDKFKAERPYLHQEADFRLKKYYSKFLIS